MRACPKEVMATVVLITNRPEEWPELALIMPA